MPLLQSMCVACFALPSSSKDTGVIWVSELKMSKPNEGLDVAGKKRGGQRRG